MPWKFPKMQIFTIRISLKNVKYCDKYFWCWNAKYIWFNLGAKKLRFGQKPLYAPCLWGAESSFFNTVLIMGERRTLEVKINHSWKLNSRNYIQIFQSRLGHEKKQRKHAPGTLLFPLNGSIFQLPWGVAVSIFGTSSYPPINSFLFMYISITIHPFNMQPRSERPLLNTLPL